MKMKSKSQHANSTRRPIIRGLMGVAVVVFGLTAGRMALAANPTFAIVGPAEWNLPIVPSANVFIQTAVAPQINNRAYGANGDTKHIPVSHTFIGITRFAHLFSFKATPHVGYFWEVLLPEVRVQGTGTGVSGMGDPLLDLAVYTRPTKSFLVGFQNILSIPIGNSNLTNNYWEEYPTFITDKTFGKFGLDATLGAGIPSTRHANGEPDQNVGNMYFAEMSARYQVRPWLAPFVTFNYQINEPGRIHDINNTYVPGSHEDVAGAGVKINLFSQNDWLDIWYNRGFSGRNTVQTNAIYMRWVFIL